jgi:type I restriction enzyme, S subunit
MATRDRAPVGWSATTYGDVMSESDERAEERIDLPVLSMTKARGPMLASERFGRVMHGRDLTRYRVARRGQVVVDPMLLWDGSIGLQRAVDAGLVSPDYRVYDARSHVDSDWLAFLIRSAEMMPYYQGGARGTNVRRNRIARGDFLRIPVALPPAREQRKIAAILSSVDDAIEATQAVIDQLQVVKKAMMAELLTRGLPGKHTKFVDTDVGPIPATWSVAPCGHLFEVQLGKMMSVAARVGDEQYPYLRNENVYWHRFDLSDVSTMHFDARERAKFRLQKGDLLACEGRHIGRCALWRGELDECYYQKALHRLRARSDELTTEYMQFFMMLRFRHQTDLVAEANATSTIPHLPREKLLALPLWYPPRSEQEEIVSALRSADEREQSEERTLHGLRHLKSALSSALLTGDLRVPLTQDPTP